MFIYILNAQGTDLYKIGITKGSTARRIKSLQTGNPNPIVEVYKHNCEHATTVERCLHRHYAHVREQGEWFNFTDTSIEDVKVKLHSFDEIANTIKNGKEESSY